MKKAEMLHHLSDEVQNEVNEIMDLVISHVVKNNIGTLIPALAAGQLIFAYLMTASKLDHQNGHSVASITDKQREFLDNLSMAIKVSYEHYVYEELK